MMYQTILCATDGLEHSDRALQHANRLAAETAAELHLVHIVEPPFMSGPLTGEYAGPTPRERAARLATQIEQMTSGQTVHVTPHVLRAVHGSRARQIASIAARIDADVIVVGSRGRTALGGALTGSVSQRLAHHTARPIVVVPSRSGPDTASRRRETQTAHSPAP